MKNFILKLIGIDVKTLNKLITLQEAVDKLTSATKDSCKTSLQIISLLKKVDINSERYWDDLELSFNSDTETSMLIRQIKKSAMKDFILENPILKERFIFHGGCLSCVTPIKQGCGTCLGCSLANWDKRREMPNLRTEE